MSPKRRQKRGPIQSRFGIDSATARALLRPGEPEVQPHYFCDGPRGNRDPRDPYGKTRMHLLGQFTGQVGGMDEHDVYIRYEQEHPEFAAQLEAELQRLEKEGRTPIT